MNRCALALLCVMLAGWLCVPEAEAKGMWSAVAVTRQKDTWYIDQTLGYSKRGVITMSRGVLKFVPGKASALREEIRECLDLDGVAPGDFAYFTAYLTADCRKGLLQFSRVTYFDSEDKPLWQQDHEETQFYLPTPGSSAEAISWHLCLNRPGFFDTLKKKKPFLYFFPEDEPSK